MHESGRPVQRAEMLQVLQSLEAVLIQTVYDHKMASVGLSDVAMDTTVTYATSHGRAHSVEDCRCLTQLDRGPQARLLGGHLTGQGCTREVSPSRFLPSVLS